MLTLLRFPHSRLMAKPEIEPGFTCIWLGTNKYTRKVLETLRNPRVSLVFCDTDGYAAFTGEVEIIVDKAQRKEHWRDEMYLFYPEGPDGDRFVLLKLVPHQLEVISGKHKVASDPNEWIPAVLVRDGQHGTWRKKNPNAAILAKLRGRS